MGRVFLGNQVLGRLDEPRNLLDLAQAAADVAGGHARRAGGRGQLIRRLDDDGVREFLADRRDARQRGLQDVEELIRAGQEVLHGLQLDGHGGVLHAHGVLEGGLEDGLGNPARIALVVKGRHDEAVAQVEVGLPVDGIVLIRPGHVPDGSTWPGHRGETVGGGAQGVFGVIPLDEQRQRLPNVFRHDAREEAHPPAVVFHVNAAVQRAGVVLLRIEVGLRVTDSAQRVLGKVVVIDGVLGRTPHEVGAVHALTGGAQLGTLLQVEHLATHDEGLGGVARCLNRTEDGIRLDGDVIIHVKDVRRVGILQRLEHDAGVAARAAQVALAEFAEALTEVRYGLVIARLVRRVLVALVRHEDIVDDAVHHRILRQRLQRRDGVGGSVEGRNAHGHALLLRRVLATVRQELRVRGVGGAPGDVGKHGVLNGRGIEPQQAAVLEVLQGQLKLVVAGGHHVVGHGDALAVLLGTVEGNVGFALDVHDQHDGLQLGPAAPVGGREGVEVGLEGGLFAGRDGHGGAAAPAEALAVLLGLDEVEHADVDRLATLGQQDALYGFVRSRFVGSHDIFGSPHRFRQYSETKISG